MQGVLNPGLQAHMEQQQQAEDTALIILLEACRLGRPLEQLALFRNCRNLDARRLALQWEARALGQTGLSGMLKVQQRQKLLRDQISSLLATMPNLADLYRSMTRKPKGKGGAAAAARKVPAGLLTGGNAVQPVMVFKPQPPPPAVPDLFMQAAAAAAQHQAAAQLAGLEGMHMLGGPVPLLMSD